MQTALRFPYVAVAAAAITLVSACATSNGVSIAPLSSSAVSPNSVSAPSAQSGDLLYVVNRFASDGVSVLTFPQGTLVTTIKIGTVRGICSDASGNVWMTTAVKGSGPLHVYKFRHGGTKPVEDLSTRQHIYGCAVDPTTGDLAVISYGGSEDGVVDIWRGAREGKPAVYYVGIPPSACAYDQRGNLFVDGTGGVGAALAELAKGAKYFTELNLGNNAGWTIGSVQWDGKYIALGAGTLSGSSSIYRVRISGTRGRIVDMLHLQHLASSPHFVIRNGEIVATQRGKVVRRAGLYNYPGGGKALAEFAGFNHPVGLTISVAPK